MAADQRRRSPFAPVSTRLENFGANSVDGQDLLGEPNPALQKCATGTGMEHGVYRSSNL